MSSLTRLRSRLSPAERSYYEFLWTHFLAQKAWPATWHVYRTYLEKQKLAKVLAGAGYNLHTENTSVNPRTFELNLVGMLATGKGESYQRWLIAFFEFMRDRFYAGENGQTIFNQSTVQQALSLSEQEADELGQLVRGGFLGVHSVWQPNADGWQIYLPCHTLEDFPRHGSLKREINVALDRLVAQSKRSRKSHAAPRGFRGGDLFAEIGFAGEAAQPKRYQVFVSSTFDDLKEERKQVVQSLLEMRCFPAGMELFPATNEEQWKLIKSVIDESDYYIVIVAARYGTLVSGTTTSYTEREFDYAKRIGKPIYGFYHSDPGKIIGDKTERTLVGKQRRERFVAKIKSNRLCRSWSSAHELGGAVLSSLQQAFKDQPRVGWIRAN
jgi:hypothetical protein